jgi:hypothetical protein
MYIELYYLSITLVLHNFTLYQILLERLNQEDETGGHVARMKETRSAYKHLVGNLKRPRPKWKDNIKMDIKKYDVRVWTRFSRLKIES